MIDQRVAHFARRALAATLAASLLAAAACASSDPSELPAAPDTAVTAEPVTAEPVTAEPVTAEPDTAEPDTAEPDTTEPDTTEPDTTEPDTTEPDTTEPDTEPDTTEPDTTEPDTTEPDTTEPVTTEPVTTEPDTTEPVTTEPVTTEPDTTEPDTTEPDTTEPDTTEPDTTEPDTTEPDTTEPDTTEPDTTEPDTTEPDTTEPDTTEPDTTEPVEGSVDGSESVWVEPYAGYVPEVHPDTPTLSWVLDPTRSTRPPTPEGLPAFSSVGAGTGDLPRPTPGLVEWSDWCVSTDLRDNDCAYALYQSVWALDYLGASQDCIINEITAQAERFDPNGGRSIFNDVRGWFLCPTVIMPDADTHSTTTTFSGEQMAQRCSEVLPDDVILEVARPPAVVDDESVWELAHGNCEEWGKQITSGAYIPLEYAAVWLAAEWLQHYHGAPPLWSPL